MVLKMKTQKGTVMQVETSTELNLTLTMTFLFYDIFELKISKCNILEALFYLSCEGANDGEDLVGVNVSLL